MNKNPHLVAAFVNLFVLVAGAAATHAETTGRGMRDDAMPAIDGGLEISIGVAATETVGDIGGGMDAGDMIGSASEVELQLGTRVTPNLAIGFYATGQGNAEGSTPSRDVYSGSAGVEADIHFRPGFALDPWISVGSGLRAMLVDADGVSLLVGAEVARVQLGVDLRATESFAITPVIGASASLYGAERPAMGDFAELDEKGINWTLTAGVAARINLFGTRR